MTDTGRTQCWIQVGQTKLEFWVANDLLTAPASPRQDRRQDEAGSQALRSFTLALSLEASRVRRSNNEPK